MSILADVFVSDPPDAAGYEAALRSRSLNAEFPTRAEMRGLTDLNFSILWALLKNEPWDLKRHELELIFFGPGSESWLFRFPEQFVSTLASLDTSATLSVANKWANTEELSCAPSEVEPIVRDLTRQSRFAIQRSRSVRQAGTLRVLRSASLHASIDGIE